MLSSDSQCHTAWLIAFSNLNSDLSVRPFVLLFGDAFVENRENRCFSIDNSQVHIIDTTRRIKIARFSNAVFSVFSNDKNKNYNTIWSAWEFSKNWEQQEVCSLICLEVMLFQSKDNKRWVVKRVWKKIHPITLRDEQQCARGLAFAE